MRSKKASLFIHSVYIKLVCLWLITIVIAGCSSPAAKLQHYATTHHLKTITVANSGIPLITFNNIEQSAHPQRVYIYLEGDGRPWEKGIWPASDPNTIQSIMLPLLILGSRPSLYISRPCYGWEVLPDGCDPSLWTAARYSQHVITLLNNAITQFKQTYRTQEFILVGHSGGGALALLLASIRQDVRGVITLAGNLDHREWTGYFGYLPLTQSLPPPAASSVSSQEHWHLVAGKDRVIPEPLLRAAIEQYPESKLYYYADFDHRCCWENIWTNTLDAFESTLTKH